MRGLYIILYNSETNTLRLHLYEWLLPSARPVEIRCVPLVIMFSESIKWTLAYGLSGTKC